MAAERHHRKLARVGVRLSLQPGAPPRELSAYEALRLADQRRIAGDFPGAAHLCQQLRATPAAFTESRVILLDIAFKLARAAEMRRYADEILARPPKDIFGLRVLAAALRELDRHREAIELLNRAIREYPTSAGLREQRALTFTDLGERDLAEQDVRTAIRLEPGSFTHYRLLSFIADLDDGELAALESAAAAGRGGADLGFTLARAWQKRGDVAREFHYLDLANQAAGRASAWREEEDDRITAATMRIIDTAYAAGRAVEAAAADPRPVFVVSMPRSGSTLVEQVLAAQPGVGAFGETRIFHWVATDLAQGRFGAHVFPEAWGGFERRDLRALGERYLQVVREVYTPATTFVDKQLENDLYLGLLALGLPAARFVHVVRNPFDACLSCYQQVFAAVPYAHSLRNLAVRYRNKMRLMDHWKNLFPGRILTVAYEDLVADPRAGARRLLDFCGLGAGEGAVEATPAGRAVRTASVQQVRQGIYTSSVEKWRPYASYLGPVREVLGP